ncbi:MAG: HAMP domain-containing protein [Chitinophagaceae bacterium]|nr:HAMP domain-containing protein [Chitinophagaceae bacterium]
MFLKDIPIKQKLQRVIVLIWSLVLVVTCVGFLGYEIYVYRSETLEKMSVVGGMISSNSTASLTFDNREDATEILSALANEPHIVQAALYDANNNLFAIYPQTAGKNTFPSKASAVKYHYVNGHFQGMQPVMLEKKQIGMLFLKFDINALYLRLGVFGIVVLLVTALSWWLAFLLSKNLQQVISTPILALAGAARAVTEKRDYSTRATKYGNDELGYLTDSFNKMLAEAGEFAHQLEEKVRERTLQLQTLNNELESFSYSVSHDLRAPLRAVNGYATMLKEDYGDRIDAEGNRYMDSIIEDAGRMGTLIDDLLAFSRIGRKEVVLQEVDMKTLVSMCLQEMNQDASLARYRIVVSDNLPDCQGDHALLKQVWMNVIGNAVKYSSKRDHPEIYIDYVDDPAEYVYKISDNGVGFDMKYVHKLFGVFQRLHSDQEFEGTGIGLALVHRIVSKHRGRTWAEAVVGKGATIYFSIPKNNLSHEYS